MIKIKNQAEWDDLQALLENCTRYDVVSFQKMSKLLNPKNRKKQLNLWLMLNAYEICSRGRRILLADRKSKSWVQYIKAHWTDESMQNWVCDTFDLSRSAYGYYNYGPKYKLAEFLHVNRRNIANISWPFKR